MPALYSVLSPREWRGMMCKGPAPTDNTLHYTSSFEFHF
jgi:hypothetical protein